MSRPEQPAPDALGGQPPDPNERHEAIEWRVHTTIAKYDGDFTAEQIDGGEADDAHLETVEADGNLLLIGGVSAIWQMLIGNGTATGGQALTFFNNGNARICVGTASTAEADTQTTLTGLVGKAMDATYPLHTDSTGTAGSKTITFRSTFASADANQAWNEWGVDNGRRAKVGWCSRSSDPRPRRAPSRGRARPR
jgi:hypothetical protein